MRVAVPLTLKGSWDWAPGPVVKASEATEKLIDKAVHEPEVEEDYADRTKGPSIRVMLRLMKACSVEILRRVWQRAREIASSSVR